jgi:hypothetical protein
LLPSGTTGIADIIKSDVAVWAKVVKEAGIAADGAAEAKSGRRCGNFA